MQNSQRILDKIQEKLKSNHPGVYAKSWETNQWPLGRIRPIQL